MNKEFYLGINSIIRDLETASNFFKEPKDDNPEENNKIRTYILYFLGCLYYKTDNLLGAKQKFEECVKLNHWPDPDIKKSTHALLKNIEECKIKPSWWEWWLYSPTYRWKQYIFWVILVIIIGLIALHPFIYDMFLHHSIKYIQNNFTDIYYNLTKIESIQTLSPLNWNIYILAIILLVFILLLPRIRQIAGQGITIQIEKTEPMAGFHFPMPLIRFESMDISELKKSSQMFIPPARKLTTKCAPVYPEFLELDLWE